ncbi:MAG: ATPase, T2SS/T4P/T4SS family [Nanoarchaeota archaeon]
MQFREGVPLYSYEVKREGGEDILYVNYMGAPYVPSLEDSPDVMERTVDSLIENPQASRIVFAQQKNYNYDFRETSMLLEIAQRYVFLLKQERILSQEKLISPGFDQFFSQRYNELFSFLFLLKRDPILAYNDLNRLRIEALISLDKKNEKYKADQAGYIRLLEKVIGLLENTKIIQAIMPYMNDYSSGDRNIYHRIFKADAIPNFTFTRLVSDLPADAEIINQYKITGDDYDESLVTILKRKNEPKLIYHLLPPENTLSEDHNILLNLARGVLIEHQPKAEEFVDTERTRQVFFNISRDLLQDLAQTKKISLSFSEINKLAVILVRHTIGFGLIEVLLQDKKLQDISLNAPIPMTSVFVRHQDYDECITNILPSQEDTDSWAAKFRLISGRPLDEANPILDTQLEIGKIRARIAIIQRPLSPDGLAYSIRRHREEPWTLPLFIQNKMINPFAAGLMSFMIDGARTILVAGTRSSGKSSLLGSLMLEIIPKFRVIVIEDSVIGDSRIIVKENGKFKKTTVGELIDSRIKDKGFIDIDGREKVINPENLEIFSVDDEGKVVLTKPSKLIKHEVNKPIYEVITTSGKKINVTGDHSLFSLDEKKILREVKSKDLKKGDFIAVPYNLPFNNNLDGINLLDYLYSLGDVFVGGRGIGKYISEKRKELFSLAYSLGYNKSTIQNWTVKNILPSKIFIKIREQIQEDGLYIKSFGASQSISAKIILDKDFLNFMGLWLADGSYDKKSIIISVMEEENKELVKKIANKLNLSVKNHSDKFSLMINSGLLKEVMQKVLDLNGNSHTKRMPSWIFNLSNEQTGWILQGFYSGDGCASDKEVVFSSSSKELVNDIATMLLRFNIVLRISNNPNPKYTTYGKDDSVPCRIGSTKMLNEFRKNIGFLTKEKQRNLEKLSIRMSTHDTSDVIPISQEVKEELHEILGNKFNKYDYIDRKNNIGREKLKELLKEVPFGITNPIDPLRAIVSSDIFWDKVLDARKAKENKKYVYDISVPGHENFICENIVAHNTLELPVESLRKLGYDILRMKVRSALLKTTSELSADDGIRTSLRLGDSCLIIGEVRSVEAKALYEAMRIGALANVVAGTIHGASPYAVFDRVVNDLEVPTTSFKATDLIAVANPIKSPDGLHSWKRLLQFAEVRKHWKQDPLLEKGFVDLMRYNVEKDELEPTEDLINGESEIIKDIASNVRGWAGNWDAVYDNILLRAKIKKELVDTAQKTGDLNLLESEFNTLANHSFHEISDNITKEIGLPMSTRVFPDWQKWLNTEVKKRKG